MNGLERTGTDWSGLMIIEYGLKGILLLLDIGFLGCFIIFQVAAWAEFRNNQKITATGGKVDRSVTPMFFLFSIASGLISIVLSGAIMTGWWV